MALLKSFGASLLLLSALIWVHAAAAITKDNYDLHKYHPSPKLMGPAKFSHRDDPILNKLDEALAKISTVYMQALFSGTHTPELDLRMRSMEIELFDLLDALYKQQRMSDYMKYEAEVTRQMILYNMLKKLFGYSVEENERVE